MQAPQKCQAKDDATAKAQEGVIVMSGKLRASFSMTIWGTNLKIAGVSCSSQGCGIFKHEWATLLLESASINSTLIDPMG